MGVAPKSSSGSFPYKPSICGYPPRIDPPVYRQAHFTQGARHVLVDPISLAMRAPKEAMSCETAV